MPQLLSRRISSTVREADLEALEAIQMMETYAPMNSAYSIDTLNALNEARLTAERREAQAEHALNAARDALTAAEQALHTAIQGAKVQVAAQYGNDSDEIQALGLKKKSKYRRSRGRRTTTNGG